jgi:CDP-diacylglycerol--glycerol-3-phosphate 3-phosphatidyltransferase
LPLNLPNILTLLRIAAIPILVLFAHLESPWGNWGAAALFGAAALTDLLDGWLARRSGQTTVFGAFLDPVADKLIVATALVLLTARFDDVLITLCACVVIGREVVVSALREWMARLGKEASVAVNQIAKVKTTLQMIAISFLLLLLPEYATTGWFILGKTVLIVAVLLTLWSMVVYLRSFFSVIRESEGQ